jgi:hypothetical protein
MKINFLIASNCMRNDKIEKESDKGKGKGRGRTCSKILVH